MCVVVAGRHFRGVVCAALRSYDDAAASLQCGEAEPIGLDRAFAGSAHRRMVRQGNRRGSVQSSGRGGQNCDYAVRTTE